MLKLVRDLLPKKGHVFVVMPFGRKVLPDGCERDFDELYDKVLKPAITELQMTPERADDIYAASSVMDSVWRGIQEAQLVLVVATGRFPNTAFELALATVLRKPTIVMTESKDDLPSDFQGEKYITYNAHDGAALFTAIRQMQETIRQRCGEPINEMNLVPMLGPGVAKVSTTVISVVKDAVTVRTDDGRTGVMGPRDVSWSKVVPDLTKRFRVGDPLDGAFEVDVSGNQRYSLIANEPNPWPDLIERLMPGTATTGSVRNVVNELGAFVEVAPGIDGLVPHFSIPAHVDLRVGSTVRVVVQRIDPDLRRIDLRLDDALADRVPDAAPTPMLAVQVGDRLEATVAKTAAESGYILVGLDGLVRPAILHRSRMSEELRSDLATGEVEIGEVLDVEVVEVDSVRRRVVVAEPTDPVSNAS